MGNNFKQLPNGEFAEHVNLTNAYDQADDMMKVKSLQKKWKESFTAPLNALNTDNWDLVQTGAGQAVAVANGVMTITSGTTANAETILRTKEVFTDPFRALFGFMVSQKIANTDLILEAISVDKDTQIPDGKHSVAWRVSGSDSVTATQAVYLTQNGGLAPLASASSSIVNSTATYNILELELFSDEVWYHSRGMDNANGRTASFVRHQQIPDPNALFKIQIRMLNRAVAPVSSTTASFQFVTVIDYAELTAEITAGRGNVSSGQGMAVNVVNTVPAVTTVSTAYTAPKSVFQSETVANIAVATPFSGTIRDIGATPLYSKYRLRIFSDQPLKIEVFSGSSATLTANRVQQVIEVPASTMTVVDVPICARYIGIKATNTGTATTTAVEIISALLS